MDSACLAEQIPPDIEAEWLHHHMHADCPWRTGRHGEWGRCPWAGKSVRMAASQPSIRWPGSPQRVDSSASRLAGAAVRPGQPWHASSSIRARL